MQKNYVIFAVAILSEVSCAGEVSLYKVAFDILENGRDVNTTIEMRWQFSPNEIDSVLTREHWRTINCGEVRKVKGKTVKGLDLEDLVLEPNYHQHNRIKWRFPAGTNPNELADGSDGVVLNYLGVCAGPRCESGSCIFVADWVRWMKANIQKMVVNVRFQYARPEPEVQYLHGSSGGGSSGAETSVYMDTSGFQNSQLTLHNVAPCSPSCAKTAVPYAIQYEADLFQHGAGQCYKECAPPSGVSSLAWHYRISLAFITVTLAVVLL